MTAHTLFLITVALVCLDIVITYKLYSGVEEYRDDCFRHIREQIKEVRDDFRHTPQQLSEMKSELQSCRYSINSHIQEFEKKLKNFSVKRSKSTKKNTGKSKE